MVRIAPGRERRGRDRGRLGLAHDTRRTLRRQDLEVATKRDRTDAILELAALCLALSQRVAVLEARPTLKYLGPWKSTDEYSENSLVTHSGSMFVATIKSKGLRPGDGSAWKLCCKRGRDGRDLR